MTISSPNNTSGPVKITDLVRGQNAERRFAALAAAVREHEARGADYPWSRRPHDAALYRRLRQICGDH